MMTFIFLTGIMITNAQVSVETNSDSGQKIAILPSLKFPSGEPTIEFRKNGSGIVEFHNQDAAAFDVVNNPVNYTFKNAEGTVQKKFVLPPNNRWQECPAELLEMLKKEGEMSFKVLMRTHKYDLTGAAEGLNHL